VDHASVNGATRDSDTPTLEEGLDGSASQDTPKDRPSITVLVGPDPGLLVGLSDGEVTCGRSQRASCRLQGEGVGLLHARFFEQSGQYWVEDLGTGTGTRVRGRRITTPSRLRDGDHVQTGEVVLRFNLYNALEEAAAIELYENSIHDATSGAFNREHFERHLAAELTATARTHCALALLMMDVDEFKRINDDFGHVFGDAVLRVVTANVQRLLRPRDLLARFGGDELVVLCPETSLRNGLILGERIRSSIEHLTLSAAGNDVHVSVSVGVATNGEGDDEMLSLIGAADRAMYTAKCRGRNRVAGARSRAQHGR
jgi:diguanylate cyclase (GGDEF)-like protein